MARTVGSERSNAGSLGARLLAGVLVLLPLCLATACSRDKDDVVEQRRRLLAPADIKAEKQKRAEARKLFDDEGRLLASDLSVADGLVMPRGISLQREDKREWYFKTRQVEPEKLIEYFKHRLLPEEIERSKAGAVTFHRARIRDAPKAPTVRVRVDPLRGGPRAAVVHVRQAAPAPRYQSGAQSEAQLEALRKYRE